MQQETSSLFFTQSGSTDDPFQPHGLNPIHRVSDTPGRAKSIVVKDLKTTTLLPILRENIAAEATVYTDDASYHRKLGYTFAEHDFTNHSAGEYGRGVVHTNTVEGYFSIFKRGMKGVYQHCNKKHLHRYAGEFEFRYSNRVANGPDDLARTDIALLGVVGKRLSYTRID